MYILYGHNSEKVIHSLFTIGALLIAKYIIVGIVLFLLVHCFPFPLVLRRRFMAPVSCGQLLSRSSHFLLPVPCPLTLCHLFPSLRTPLHNSLCVVAVHWPFGVFPSMVFEQKRNLKLYYAGCAATLLFYMHSLNIFQLICL